MAHDEPKGWRVPEDVPQVNAGQRLQVWMLDWPEEVDL